ncbi:hypothetical protein N9V75_00300 [Luminiphilus sp.]|nr:hypothetical protein [Luminiphilus sp.]
MKKLLIALLISTPLVGGVWADEPADGPAMLGFYHFYAPNPGAVVAAMDKFWASDCGKEYPADVALAAEVFNGGYDSSHFILNTYPNAAAQEKAVNIMATCADGQQFLMELQAAGVVGTRQLLGFHAAEGGDWTEDSAFAKFDIKVEGQNQGAYVAAWQKMMSAVMKDIDISSYGVGVVVFGNDAFNHWVYVGAKTSTELAAVQQAILTNPGFSAFAKETSTLRENVNTTLVQIVKGYSRN